MKVKGEVERDVKAVQLAQLSIHKPGLIDNRRNDFRLGEAIASYIPFIKKIDAADLGHFILLHAIAKCTRPGPEGEIQELDNDQIRTGLRWYIQTQTEQKSV